MIVVMKMMTMRLIFTMMVVIIICDIDHFTILELETAGSDTHHHSSSLEDTSSWREIGDKNNDDHDDGNYVDFGHLATFLIRYNWL